MSPAVAAATVAIERVRQRYEAALKNRSLDEIKVVWPDMPRVAQRNFSNKVKDARPVGLDLECQRPEFTDLERAPSGRKPTAVLSCYEIRHVLWPAGGVRESTRVPSTIYLASGQEWVITNVASPLFK